MLPMKSSPFNQMTLLPTKTPPSRLSIIECQPVDGSVRGEDSSLAVYKRTKEPTFCDVAPAETTGVPAFGIQKHMIQALTRFRFEHL
jgi:hypothetical protein